MMQIGLNTISGLLEQPEASPLSSIQQSQQQSANFEQQVVFPLAAINQARRNMAVQFEGQFVQMRQLFQLPIGSANIRPCRKCLNRVCSPVIQAQCHILMSNYYSLYGTA